MRSFFKGLAAAATMALPLGACVFLPESRDTQIENGENLHGCLGQDSNKTNQFCPHVSLSGHNFAAKGQAWKDNCQNILMWAGEKAITLPTRKSPNSYGQLCDKGGGLFSFTFK